jgi:hypothetical protein
VFGGLSLKIKSNFLPPNLRKRSLKPIIFVKSQTSFHLRLWRDNPDSKWRASLEATNSTHKHTFPNLAVLVTYLEETMGEKVVMETAVSPQHHNTEAHFM